MTPGPIAVNTATFYWLQNCKIFGRAVATLGVGLPSFILIISTAYILNKYKNTPVAGKNPIWNKASSSSINYRSCILCRKKYNV